MKFDKITLSNTDFLLYWARFFSAKNGAITPLDRINLVKKSFFKNKKAISNAIYQLHLDGKMMKYQDDWYITDYGDAYLEAVLENINKKTNVDVPAKGPKKDDWTDADFGITPAVREYINKLEAENARLKELLENYKQMHNSNLATYDELVEKNVELEKKLKNANDVIVKLQNDLQQVIMSNRYIRDSNDSLRHRITELKKKLESNNTIDDNLKIAFQNCAKAFNVLAGI